MSNKYRVKFTKEDEIKFIGHLDLIRLFQRAMCRAELPIAYSQGFNPHQSTSFANPLSLGMTSDGEYADFEFKYEIAPESIKNRLNEVLPQGIKIKRAVKLRDKVDKVMADLSGSEYEACLDSKVSKEMLERNIPLFMEQKEILVMKKTKHKFEETDIRPDIISLESISDDTSVKVKMTLAAGSIRNLRADLVINTLYDFMGVEFNKYGIRYKRNDMFRLENEVLVPLDRGVEEL